MPDPVGREAADGLRQRARGRPGLACPPVVDVALLSLGTTLGLRHADDALAELLAAAGLSCRVVRVRFGATARLRRQITAIDVVEGLAARRAARATRDARAVIVSGATTALLLRRPQVPWAIRFDSPTALNRPGASGAWQRARERQVFRAADLLLPWGRAAADAAAPLVDGETPIVPLPVPVEAPPASQESSDEVVAYAGWLWKRGIDVLCAAWGKVDAPGARLVIGGAERAAGLAWLERCGVPEPPNVEWAGSLPHDEWLARVARARLFVNASRREDHGIAQLEALAAGTPLRHRPLAGRLRGAADRPPPRPRGLRLRRPRSGDPRRARAGRPRRLRAPRRRGPAPLPPRRRARHRPRRAGARPRPRVASRAMSTEHSASSAPASRSSRSTRRRAAGPRCTATSTRRCSSSTRGRSRSPSAAGARGAAGRHRRRAARHATRLRELRRRSPPWGMTPAIHAQPPGSVTEWL